MNIIVAVDKNWGIGLHGKMLVTIPSDQRFFRDETSGKVVVMGRRTYEALPTGQPLVNRTNIILTKDRNYNVKGATIVHSKEELMDLLKQYRSEDIYIIGGQTIYEMMMEYCDVAHVTKIDFAYEADTFHPNLDEMEDWVVAAQSDEQTYYNLEYTFVRYERKRS